MNNNSKINASEIAYKDSGNNIDTLDNIIKCLKGQILWTNPNPTVAFAPQTITLLGSNYDMYEVVFYGSQTGANVFNTGKIPKGMNAYLNQTFSGSGEANIRTRLISYSTENTLSVKEGFLNGAITNNQCIPVYIIGYKTNLFS